MAVHIKKANGFLDIKGCINTLDRCLLNILEVLVFPGSFLLYFVLFVVKL